MDITSKQLDLIVSKFLLYVAFQLGFYVWSCRQLPNLKHEEVPPLCYQLLLLSKKVCEGSECYRKAFRAVSVLF